MNPCLESAEQLFELHELVDDGAHHALIAEVEASYLEASYLEALWADLCLTPFVRNIRPCAVLPLVFSSHSYL